MSKRFSGSSLRVKHSNDTKISSSQYTESRVFMLNKWSQENIKSCATVTKEPAWPRGSGTIYRQNKKTTTTKRRPDYEPAEHG